MEISTSLNFNLFGNVLHRKKTNQRQTQTLTSSMMKFFVIICQKFITYRKNSFSLDDVGIVDCLCMLLFSVFMTKLEALRRAITQMTQTFHILVPSFFFRCEEYNLLFHVLGNDGSLIDAFVYQHFYKVLRFM